MKNGILIIDKEKGVTSRDVVNQVCKKLSTKRIGHTGTLDPLATGVLVLAVGEATKLVPFLTSSEKEYIAEVLLGVFTDTLDITGNTLKEEKVQVSEDDVRQVLEDFPKRYEQEVPKFSAVHVGGKRLYEYARSDIEVVLPKREVEIKELELLSFEKKDGKQYFSFRCVVSKGTYIRSLISDIGKELKVSSTMTNLRRTRQGIFDIEKAKDVTEITFDDMISMKDSLSNYPVYVVSSDEELFQVKNGCKLKKEMDGITSFVDKEGHLLAIYERKEEGMIRPLKVFHDN